MTSSGFQTRGPIWTSSFVSATGPQTSKLLQWRLEHQNNLESPLPHPQIGGRFQLAGNAAGCAGHSMIERTIFEGAAAERLTRCVACRKSSGLAQGISLNC